MLSPHLVATISLGFVSVLLLAFFVNKLGDLVFMKGLATPFYIGGRRIHHRDVLLVGLPAAYTLVASLILLQIVRVEWSALLNGIETTFFIVAACFVADILLDRASVGSTVRALLPHEIIYLLIPTYVFTHLVIVPI